MAGLLDDILGYGRDVAQGASNSIAGNVSAPVDGLAWLLRKTGVPVPSNPVGGSDWMNQQGLTQQPQSRTAGLLGDFLGMAGPMVAAAKAPQVAAGLLGMADNLATPRAMNSQTGAVLISPQGGLTDAARDEAMRAVKYDRGWYRGGPEITDGKKTGDWYTRFKDEASDYAARTPGAEVREYAAPINTIKSNSAYSPRLAQDIATKVEALSPEGAKLAKQLREYYANDKISGLEVWSGLSKHLGDDTAANVLKELGFKGVEGVKKPQYLQTFPSTMVRDANQAAFNPARLDQNDIYGKATPGLLALTAGGAAGLAAFRSNRGNE